MKEPKRSVGLELLRQVAENATEILPADIDILTAQLGREPRGLVGIGARCACGVPAVTVTYPRLPDGSPFPTLFYLSLPWAVKAVSRIESAGEMAQMNERLGCEPDLAQSYAGAHLIYVKRRNLLEEIPQIGGKSAGGMPDRVKCLHALAAYALAAGKGICRFGDEVLERIGWDPDRCRCARS